MTGDVWNALQAYLNRLGQAEYSKGTAAHKGKRPYRHAISEYHATLVRLLGDNNEEEFKALKMLQGPHSALGV